MPTITKQPTEHGPIYNAHNSETVAAVAFHHPPEDVLPPELVNFYSATETATDALMSRVAQITHYAHPDRVPDLIARAITELLGKVFPALVDTGVKSSRQLDEAWDRIATPGPTTPDNAGVRSDYRQILINHDHRGRMELPARPGAPLELLAAALEIADVLDLPETYVEEIERRFVIANTIETHSLAADAGLKPTPTNPFQHGLDQAKAVEMAESMIAAHDAKRDALADVGAAASRLVSMLSVACGRSVDATWELLMAGK